MPVSGWIEWTRFYFEIFLRCKPGFNGERCENQNPKPSSNCKWNLFFRKTIFIDLDILSGWYSGWSFWRTCFNCFTYRWIYLCFTKNTKSQVWIEDFDEAYFSFYCIYRMLKADAPLMESLPIGPINNPAYSSDA